jgi:phosphate:Na+ symporter
LGNISLPTKASISFEGSKYFIEGKQPAEIKISVIDNLGQPCKNVELLIQNAGSDSVLIEPESDKTDEQGKLKVFISNYKAGGDYVIICLTNEQHYKVQPAIYEFEVWRKQWAVLMIIGLLGGLSLFLLGMTQMSTGLQSSAGKQIRNILNRLSNNRFVAMGIGALITSVVQSSSATNVMLVSFVNSRLMRFKQTIGIILGAALGTTLTVQIIAFKFTDYALVFVSIGLAVQYLSKNMKVSEIGRAIMGFGILFFGMHIMSVSMIPLRLYKPFVDIIVTLEAPLVGILAGAILTAIIQSSSAFIGILIILALQHLLSLDAAIALIIGANLGTSITALLASINTTREARQVALAHTFIKSVGALLFVFLIPVFTQVIKGLEPNANGLATARQIANAHTIYNLVLCVIFLPFTDSVAWTINRIYPVRDEKDDGLTLKYIGKNLIKAPSFALKAARGEVIRLMEEVETMTELMMLPFFERDKSAIEQINKLEEKVNFLRDNISEFLVNLTRRQVNEAEVKEAFILLNATREFEQIADVISSQLKNKAIKWCNEKGEFSESGRDELKRYHLMTLSIIRKAKKVYETLDIAKAQKLENKYDSYRDEFFDLEMQHYDRLKDKIEQSVSSSRTHLEIITLLRVISSHATNTARIILHNSENNNTNDSGKTTN